MLNLEIKHINCNLHFLRIRIKEIEYQLFLHLSDYLINNFLKLNNDKAIKTKLINKFNRILFKQNVFYESFKY